MFQRLALAVLCLLCLSLPVAAQGDPVCTGRNLIAALPPGEQAALRAAAEAVPYPRGNFWRATRAGHEVLIAGTYHLDDPRHEGTMAAIGPLLDRARRLLVEAGPAEEAKLLARLARDPSAILASEGPTLAETLPPEEWALLSQAMRDRGIPPFMASRFRTWYVTMLLSVPPCALKAAAEGNGLDKRIIARAEGAGVPVSALEPFDTALKLFDGMEAEAQLALIRATLALEHQAEDQFATLAAAYFAGESRLIWEFSRKVSLDLPGMTPEAVDRDFAVMEEAMMNARNRAWIPVIEAAADEAGGPVAAAFGALHLSGHQGVLALLAARGWTVEALPVP